MERQDENRNPIKEYAGILVDYSRDRDLPEQGKALLTRKGFYKKDHENSPQETFARAATSYCFGDYEFAQRIYDYVSKGYFTFASPVLSNAVDISWPTFSEDQFEEASEWLAENVEPEGMPISCFVAGTPVFTKYGLKNIEDVKEGDLVLTHRGRFRRVIKTRESLSSDLYRIQSTRNTTELTVTGNHRLLTNNGWKRVDEIRKGVDLLANSSYIEKKLVEELTLNLEFEKKVQYNSGSYVAKDLGDSVVIDTDLAWAIGFWFAEGSTSDNGQVRVTHGDPEPCNKWQEIISDKLDLNGTYYQQKNKNWWVGEVNSVGLQRVFDKIFGKGCKAKTLPKEWMEISWEKGIFESFLEGFYLGDGFKTTKCKMFELTNVPLVSQIVLLLMEHGYDVAGQYRKYGHFNKVKGNNVYNGVVSYRDRYGIEKLSVRSGVPMTDGLIYSSVKKLERVSDTRDTLVYDLQVEEDESFSAAGIIAHNCFLSYTPDSKEGLVKTRSETAWLSMMGGGIGVYMANRSPDEKSTGVMAHLRGYDADCLSYKQTSSRRGSLAAYLDITHPEIMQFIDIRNPVGGDANQKCFNLNNAVNIPDSFMEALIKGEDYELVDPKHGPTGKYLNAAEVWRKIMETRYETGEPYIMFTDNVNRQLPDWIRNPLYQVRQSNLC